MEARLEDNEEADASEEEPELDFGMLSEKNAAESLVIRSVTDDF